MARYSRRTGPTVDFTLSTTLTLIPGLILTRHFDQGELLVLARATAANIGAVIALYKLNLAIDGTLVLPASPRASLDPGLVLTLSFGHLEPLTEGTHTLELQALSDPAPNLIIHANSAELTIIQLPLWDSPQDIT